MQESIIHSLHQSVAILLSGRYKIDLNENWTLDLDKGTISRDE